MILITEKNVNRIVERQLSSFLFSGKDLVREKQKYFALIKKSDLDREINAKKLLSKIVNEYKESRILES